MVKNKTKNLVLGRKVVICNNPLSKALGLMFSRKDKDRALVFLFKKKQIVPLHMLFVFYKIDVLFLDKDRKVVEIKRNFKPFTFYTPKSKAMYVAEVVDSKNTGVNDIVSF